MAPAAAAAASSAALSWVPSDLPSQVAYQRQLELATGIADGGKLLAGCACLPAPPGAAFCGVVITGQVRTLTLILTLTLTALH